MKNNIKRSSVALAILMGGTMLTPVHAHSDESMSASQSFGSTQLHQLVPDTQKKGSEIRTDAAIPDFLTMSQMPKAGINAWTESIFMDTAAGAPQTKLVNRNDQIKEACGYAKEAYDNHLAYKNGHYFGERDVTPFYFGGEMEGFVSYKDSVDGQKGKIIVAFRGTKEGWDWGTNLNGVIGDKAYIYGSTGTVHHGFHERYMTVRDSISAAICKYQGQYGSDTDIEVTGHSLGGASASLAAADIKQNIHSTGKLKLTTFNSPRVFDTKSAEDVTNLIGANNMIRVWRENDPVSMVGMGILGYKHVGTKVKLGAKDTAYLMNWEKEVVPNHSHKKNEEDVNGNDIIIPEQHVGKISQLRQAYADASNSSTGQVVRNLWNAATDNVVGNALGNTKDFVINKVSDGIEAAKPYGRTVIKGAIDYVVKPAVSAIVSGAGATVSACKSVGNGIVSLAKEGYDTVSNMASTACKSFWNCFGY